MKLVELTLKNLAKYNNYVFLLAKNLEVCKEATLESLDFFKSKLVWLAIII